MNEDKKPMPVDGSGTEMNKPDEIGETASRRDADMAGGLPNTGESGGGPYPNPYDDADRAKRAGEGNGDSEDDRKGFHGGQSVAGYFGKGQLGDKKLDDTQNAQAEED